MLRLKRELSLPGDEGIELRILDTWQELEATIQGPPDSPFAGGTFVLNVKLPEDYPFNSGTVPKVKFATPIWHPNVSAEDGSMCADFLSDWSASITIRSVCIFLQSLLYQPDLVKPLNLDAARQYMNSPSSYKDTAKYWTYVHAAAKRPPEDTAAFCEKEAKVWRLMTEFQKPVAVVRIALSSADWDFECAEAAILQPPPALPVVTEEAQGPTACPPPWDAPPETTAMDSPDSDSSDYEGYEDYEFGMIASDSVDESLTSGSDIGGSPR